MLKKKKKVKTIVQIVSFFEPDNERLCKGELLGEDLASLKLHCLEQAFLLNPKSAEEWIDSACKIRRYLME